MSCTGAWRPRTSSITLRRQSTGSTSPNILSILLYTFPLVATRGLFGVQLVRHLTILRPRRNQVQDSKLYRGPDSSVLLHCSALSSNGSSQPPYPFLPSPSKLLGQCLSEFTTSHHGFNSLGSPQRVPGTRHQVLLHSSTSSIWFTLPSCMGFLRREWLFI